MHNEKIFLEELMLCKLTLKQLVQVTVLLKSFDWRAKPPRMWEFSGSSMVFVIDITGPRRQMH